MYIFIIAISFIAGFKTYIFYEVLDDLPIKYQNSYGVACIFMLVGFAIIFVHNILEKLRD